MAPSSAQHSLAEHYEAVSGGHRQGKLAVPYVTIQSLIHSIVRLHPITSTNWVFMLSLMSPLENGQTPAT